MSQLNFDLNYENVSMILDEDVAVEDAATGMMRRIAAAAPFVPTYPDSPAACA